MKTEKKALYSKIGETLQRERVNAGLTQAQLATAVELKRTSITQMESGAQQAPLHVMYDLCFALKIDISELLPSSEEVAKLSVVPITVNEKTVNVPPKTAELLQQMEKLLREQSGEDDPEENYVSQHRQGRTRSTNHSRSR